MYNLKMYLTRIIINSFDSTNCSRKVHALTVLITGFGHLNHLYYLHLSKNDKRKDTMFEEGGHFLHVHKHLLYTKISAMAFDWIV